MIGYPAKLDPNSKFALKWSLNQFSNTKCSDLVQSIIELQPDDFLAKPFTVKDLNITAVDYLQKGDINHAMEVFTQAFTIMPRNTSIALNLMQAISSKAAKLGIATLSAPILKQSLKTIENGKLSESQQERYHRLLFWLSGVVSFANLDLHD